MARSSPPRPPAQQPGRALRAVALTAVVAGVLVLAAAAFLLSYSGIHAIARQSGISGQLARGYPVIIDAILVIAGAAVLALRGAGWPSKIFAWLVLLVLLAAVAGADAVHSVNAAIPHRAAAVAAVVLPWFLLLVGFGLLLAMLRHFRLHRAAAVAPQPSSAGVQRPAQPGAAQPGAAQPGPDAAPRPMPQLPPGTSVPMPALPPGAPGPARQEPAPVQPAPVQPASGRPMPAMATAPSTAPAPTPSAARPYAPSPQATAPQGTAPQGTAPQGTAPQSAGSRTTAQQATAQQAEAAQAEAAQAEAAQAEAAQAEAAQAEAAQAEAAQAEAAQQATAGQASSPQSAGSRTTAQQATAPQAADGQADEADGAEPGSAGPDAAYLDDDSDELAAPAEEIYAAPPVEDGAAGPSGDETGAEAAPPPAFHRMWSSPTPPGDEDADEAED